jgi:hypothetical protein
MYERSFAGEIRYRAEKLLANGFLPSSVPQKSWTKFTVGTWECAHRNSLH